MKRLTIYALVIGAAALFFLAFVLNTTSPLLVGPAGIMLVLSLVYICLLCLGVVVMRCLVVLAGRFGLKLPLSGKQDCYVSSVLALGPVLLLALNSIGQLDFKDLALILVFLTLGCFYVIKRA